jgi:PTH1 family peptidyl-tRNA hydrolase
MKLKSGGGHAGHNGLRSIHSHLRTDAYLRLRLGVGKPPGGPGRGADWVRSRVPAAQRTVLDEMVANAADVVESVVADGFDAAMQRVNVR